MAHKFDKKFRVSSFEKREVEINLPAYRKYYAEDSVYYVKFYIDDNGQMSQISVNLTDKHISYSGANINKSYEIEFETPHTYGYSYDFYMGIDESEIIDSAEFAKIVGQVISDALGILGVL